MIDTNLTLDHVLTRLSEFYNASEIKQYDTMLYAHGWSEESGIKFLYEQTNEHYKKTQEVLSIETVMQTYHRYKMQEK